MTQLAPVAAAQPYFADMLYAMSTLPVVVEVTPGEHSYFVKISDDQSCIISPSDEPGPDSTWDLVPDTADWELVNFETIGSVDLAHFVRLQA